MKIALVLTDPAAESAYLGLKKALPQLTPQELEDGQKESGIAPLCRQNVDERCFTTGLAIHIRAFTDPTAALSNAIIKSADLELVNKFMFALNEEVQKKQREWMALNEKMAGQKFKQLWVREQFETLRKTMSSEAYSWMFSPVYLAGLEAALVVLGKVMSPEEEKKATPPGQNIIPARNTKNRNATKKLRRKR